MPPTDSHYDALRKRYPDILPETDEDTALTRLVHDLDQYMNAPVPAPRQQPVDRVVAAATPVATVPAERAYTHPSRPHARSAPHRIGIWMGTAAAMLVVALLAGMFALRTHQNPSNGITPIATFATNAAACDPKKVRAHLPANAEFGSLAMVSPSEGWAIGAVVNPSNFAADKSLILRFHNCTWTPIATSIPGAGLTSISMGSATDGWAVGSVNSDQPLALHYENGVWREVTPSGAGAINGVYNSVRMLSADEGWIVIDHNKDSQGLLTNGLLHLAHGRWSVVDAPLPVIEAVLPVAPGDAWIAGSSSNAQESPMLYHYHEGTWTSMTSPDGVVIDQLRMVSPNDIWASGYTLAQNGDQVGAALHYDGSQWQRVAVGTSGHPRIVEAFDRGTTLAFTFGQKLDAMSAPQSYIAGVQYQHAGEWSQLAWPFTKLDGIMSVSRVAPDEYWAIGSYMVLEMTPTGNGSYSGVGHAVPVLLYFANGAWHEYGQ